MSESIRPPAPDPGPETHCGYVAIVGAPNVGKSTLLNALVGERLSSVTSKAQTTWKRVAGIRTEGDRQFVFLDTPGILDPRSLVHRSLLQEAVEAAREADVLFLVVDPTNPLSPAVRARLEEVASGRNRRAVFGIVNKLDLAGKAAVDREIGWLAEMTRDGMFLVTASTGEGVEYLLERTAEFLPRGPFLFPADEIAEAPIRFFVSELVRETIFEQYHEEVPYASFCEVEEYSERNPRSYVRVVIYVEHTSQKKILIGEGGGAIRALGAAARAKIESLVGAPIYLDLWVKVLPGWRRKEGELRRLGFTIPKEEVPAHAR